MRWLEARIALAALALALSATAALAQYPNRIIKIISPAPPGGNTDIVARLVTSRFSIMALGGTPQSAFRTIAGEPEFRKLAEQQGMDVVYFGSAEAAGFWNDEIDKWDSVIKSAGIAMQ